MDWNFDEMRAKALALPEPCGYCHAKTGQRCVNKETGEPLHHVSAHYARLRLIGFPRKMVTE